MALVSAIGGTHLWGGALMAVAGPLSPMIFTGLMPQITPLWLAVTRGIVLPILAAGAFGGWLITRFCL